MGIHIKTITDIHVIKHKFLFADRVSCWPKKHFWEAP